MVPVYHVYCFQVTQLLYLQMKQWLPNGCEPYDELDVMVGDPYWRLVKIGREPDDGLHRLWARPNRLEILHVFWTPERLQWTNGNPEWGKDPPLSNFDTY